MAVELAVLIHRKLKISVRSAFEQREFSLEEVIENNIIFGNRTVLLILTVLMLITSVLPIMTDFILDRKLTYQVLSHDGDSFVVVAELGDYVFCEKGDVENTHLNISTQSYTVLKKDNITYELKHFDSVKVSD